VSVSSPPVTSLAALARVFDSSPEMDIRCNLNIIEMENRFADWSTQF
jgi:hypothetical protein